MHYCPRHLAKIMFFMTFPALLLYIDVVEAKTRSTYCKPSAAFEPEFYPKKENVGNTNNLRRATGSGFMAEGIPILIQGTILGDNCIPIENATVEIWQADANGNYINEQDKDKHFVGSGTVYTNNLGEFTFMTIMPGTKEQHPTPVIHFNISNDTLNTLDTRMYFLDTEGNDNDEALQKAINEGHKPFAKKVKRDHKSNIYLYDIVLDGHEKFSSF